MNYTAEKFDLSISGKSSLATSATTSVFGNDHQHLEVPENDKMFLISPPASPPLGWKQIKESAPVCAMPPPLLLDGSPRSRSHSTEFTTPPASLLLQTFPTTSTTNTSSTLSPPTPSILFQPKEQQTSGPLPTIVVIPDRDDGFVFPSLPGRKIPQTRMPTREQ